MRRTPDHPDKPPPALKAYRPLSDSLIVAQHFIRHESSPGSGSLNLDEKTFAGPDTLRRPDTLDRVVFAGRSCQEADIERNVRLPQPICESRQIFGAHPVCQYEHTTRTLLLTLSNSKVDSQAQPSLCGTRFESHGWITQNGRRCEIDKENPVLSPLVCFQQPFHFGAPRLNGLLRRGGTIDQHPQIESGDRAHLRPREIKNDQHYTYCSQRLPELHPRKAPRQGGESRQEKKPLRGGQSNHAKPKV
jgi:hypothetical protein